MTDDWRGAAPQADAALRAPTFTTKRLNVFQLAMVPTDMHDWKTVFIAFRTDKDWCAPVCVATIWTENPSGPWVEWVETCDYDRREGIALELTQGIENHLGKELLSDGATEAGKALIAKREALRD